MPKPMPTPMSTATIRRWAYRLAALLAGLYGVYVIGLKLARLVTGGPLGDLGEFALVLAAVTAFAVGLFADEAHRQATAPPPPAQDGQ